MQCNVGGRKASWTVHDLSAVLGVGVEMRDEEGQSKKWEKYVSKLTAPGRRKQLRLCFPGGMDVESLVP